MVFLSTASTTRDTESITLQGVGVDSTRCEDAVLNNTAFPGWLQYLSLRVRVVSIPTHVDNNIASRQSPNKQSN